MALKVRTVADLFDKADPETYLTSINADDEKALEVISRPADEAWIEVAVRLLTQTIKCFVRAVDVVEETDPTPEPVDLWSFVDFCTVASETFNQKQATGSVGVSRDYILALALVLNGLEDKGLTEEVLQSFDPFHFTGAEWEEFCASGSNSSRYQGFDRFDPLAQIDAAIFFTFRSTSEIDRALTNPVDPAGPYIPSSMDLFLVHMLGPTGGVKALHDHAIASNGGSIPWTNFVGAGDLVTLKTRYPRFLDVAEAASVDQLLDLIESAFDKAYVEVAKMVPDALPEELAPEGGPPGWLKVAENEEATPGGVKEPDRRILDYFKATDFGPTATPTTSWCGAFAAFCMKNSGIPVPNGAARAANWGNWGKQLCSPGTPADQIPAGAVIVFAPSPGTTGSSGHVAFFVGGDSKHVQVLGGNQHDTLKESNFPRTQILHIRWPKGSNVPSSTPGTTTGSGVTPGTLSGTPSSTPSSARAEIAIGPFTAEDWEKYCFKLGERESNNNYNVVNKLGFCGRWQFGAEALMDAGYVRGTRSPRKLGDANVWTGKDEIFSRDHWLKNQPVQDKAMLELTRRNYKQLVRMNVINQSDAKSRIAGFLAVSHLLGCGNARKFAENPDNPSLRDGFGTTPQEYFDLLANEFP